MKNCKFLLVGACLGISPLSNAQKVTYNNYYMLWNFTDADGQNDRAWNDHCRCSSIYVENKAVYNSTSSTPGTPIPAMTGYYVASATSPGTSFNYTIPASSWAYGQIKEIPIPCNVSFNYDNGLNFRIQYYAGSNEIINAGVPGATYRSLYLQTRSVNVDAGPDRTFCSGSAITLGSYPSGDASSYAWSPSIPATASGGFSPITSTYTVSGTKTFTVKPTNPKGSITCTASDAMKITVNPKPQLGISLPGPICTGAPLPVLTGSSGYSDYSWSYVPSNGGFPTQLPENGPSVNTASHGFGKYSYSATNSYGCTSWSPEVNIKSDASVGANLNPSFSSTVTNPGIYGSGSMDINLSGAQAGEHRWKFYVSSTSGGSMTLVHTSSWTTSPTYVQEGISTEVYIKIVHEFRKAPCNETTSAERTIYETRKAPVSKSTARTVDNTEDMNMQIAPNPSTGIFRLTLPKASEGRIEVFDFNGKQIMDMQVKNDVNIYQLDLSGFAKGVYVIRMVTAGQVKNQKVFLE